MIIKDTPVLRRDFVPDAIGTDKSEGKFAKQSSDARTMSLITSATTIPDGVISNPDGRDGYQSNGGDLILMSHPGIIQVRLSSEPGSIDAGTELVLCADATVKASTGAAGELVVARSLAPQTSGQGGCLHEAILISRPTVKA